MAKIYIEKADKEGDFFSGKEAKISVFDLGLQRGFGVFETLRTYNSKVFKLEDHIERLLNSAQRVNLRTPWSRKELNEKINTTFRKSNLKESTLRVVITGGEEQGLMKAKEPLLIIIANKLHSYPKELYNKGVKVVTLEIERFLPKIKSINYLPSFIAMDKARKEKAHECLFLNNDFILEGTTSNFFIVTNNKLVTPDQDILLGVTRNFVINLAQDSFKVEQRKLSLNESYNAQEAFLTSTGREILPVVKINNKEIGSGKPGKITRELLERFRERVD